MMKFKSGDKIAMRYAGEYFYGEVTIVRKNEGMIKMLPNDTEICKVIFESDRAPDYWYYPASDLELESEIMKND